MKKFILSLFLCAAILPCVFAESDEEVSSDKFFGVGPGLRLSLMGVEPTVAVNIYNLELEGACAFSSGWDPTETNFGWAPSFSIAYNTKPFDKGVSSTLGLEYVYLTKTYLNMLSFSTGATDAHAASFFYRGAVNFNPHFSFLWRLRLPLMIAAPDSDGKLSGIFITSPAGFGLSWLICLCTTSIGIKFEL